MKNWKTTLTGWGLGFLNLYANGTSGKQLLLATAFGILGTLAKDFDKTNSPAPLQEAQSTK